jgi:hypothetical protein
MMSYRSQPGGASHEVAPMGDPDAERPQTQAISAQPTTGSGQRRGRRATQYAQAYGRSGATTIADTIGVLIVLGIAVIAIAGTAR